MNGSLQTLSSIQTGSFGPTSFNSRPIVTNTNGVVSSSSLTTASDVVSIATEIVDSASLSNIVPQLTIGQPSPGDQVLLTCVQDGQLTLNQLSAYNILATGSVGAPELYATETFSAPDAAISGILSVDTITTVTPGATLSIQPNVVGQTAIFPTVLCNQLGGLVETIITVGADLSMDSNSITCETLNAVSAVNTVALDASSLAINSIAPQNGSSGTVVVDGNFAVTQTLNCTQVYGDWITVYYYVANSSYQYITDFLPPGFNIIAFAQSATDLFSGVTCIESGTGNLDPAVFCVWKSGIGNQNFSSINNTTLCGLTSQYGLNINGSQMSVNANFSFYVFVSKIFSSLN